MNKYRNTKTVVDGILFSSKKESVRYGQLKLLQRAGEISGLQLQPKYMMSVNDIKICTYIADFSYTDNSGKVHVEDVKGMKTGSAYQVFKLKAKLLLACFGIDVVEI